MTHDELLRTIDDVRPPRDLSIPMALTAAREINMHLDTLRAIVELHAPWGWPDGFCQECSDPHGEYTRGWPCPTVDIVLDSLRRLGVDVDE